MSSLRDVEAKQWKAKHGRSHAGTPALAEQQIKTDKLTPELHFHGSILIGASFFLLFRNRYSRALANILRRSGQLQDGA
jgi:hypothetical protein